MTPMPVRVRKWKLIKASSWSFTAFFHCSLTSHLTDWLTEFDWRITTEKSTDHYLFKLWIVLIYKMLMSEYIVYSKLLFNCYLIFLSIICIILQCKYYILYSQQTPWPCAGVTKNQALCCINLWIATKNLFCLSDTNIMQV